MGADPDRDEDLRPDGAQLVARRFGLLRFLRVRVEQMARTAGRLASISGVLRTTHTGLPRQDTTTRWPGSILLMSISTGAPKASALALGRMEAMNGTLRKPAPTAPTTVAAWVKKRRFSGSTPSLIIRFSIPRLVKR